MDNALSIFDERMAMKKRNEIARSSVEQVVCILILLLFVLLSAISGNFQVNTDTTMRWDINDGWIDENGQSVDLYDLALGKQSVTLDISNINVDGKAIRCFKWYAVPYHCNP